MLTTTPWCAARDVEVLDTLRLPSGLTLAAPGGSYDRIWIRDNCYTGLAYWHAGCQDRAVQLFQALLRLVERHAWKIDWVLWEGKPSEPYKRVHPRYDAQGFEIPEPWGFAQNDALGLLLWCLGWLQDQGAAILTRRETHTIQKLVWYLCAIRYWEDADNGVWEEREEVHASSVGCCLAGLRAHRHRVVVPPSALAQGEAALADLGRRESRDREADLASLTLVWPLGLRGHETVSLLESALLREQGVLRYSGDQYHRGESEAQWCLGLPWLGLAWLGLGSASRAREYLAWTDRVRQGGALPEAYVPARDPSGALTYTPCEHSPLAWAHALAAILRGGLEGR